MGILQRFKDIMSANIDSVLTKAEEKNADKLLEKYLNDAKDNLEELKAETSAVIADEMACARRVTAVVDEIARMDCYAEKAVLAGNDEDAMKFLETKNRLLEEKKDREAAYANAKENSDKMRKMARKLKDDIGEAEEKMADLRAKLKMVKSQEKMGALNQKIAGRTDMSDFNEMMDAVQHRMDEVEAKSRLDADLSGGDLESLENKYAAHESEEEVSAASAKADLAALKARLGK